MAKKKRTARSSESSQSSDTSQEASTSRHKMPPPSRSPQKSRGTPRKTPQNLANKRMELMRKIISPETDNNNIIAKVKEMTNKKTNNSPGTVEKTEIQLEPQPRKKIKKDTLVLSSGDALVNLETQNFDHDKNMTNVSPSTSKGNKEMKGPPIEIGDSEPKRRINKINKQSLTIRKDKTGKNNMLKITSIDPIHLINNKTVNLTTQPRISKRKQKEESVPQNSVMNNTCTQSNEMTTAEDNNIDMFQKRPNETPQMFQLRLSLMRKKLGNKIRNTKRKEKKKENKSSSETDTSTPTVKSGIKSGTIPRRAADSNETAVESNSSESIVKDESIVVKPSNETPYMKKIRLSLAEKRMSIKKSKTPKKKTEIVRSTPGPSTPVIVMPSTSKSSWSVTPVAKTKVASDPVTRRSVAKMPVASVPVTRRPVASTPVASDPVTKRPVASSSCIETLAETHAHKQHDSFVEEKQFTTSKSTNETPAMVKLRESIAEKRKSILLEKKREHVDSVISTPESHSNNSSLQPNNQNEKNVVIQTPMQLKLDSNIRPRDQNYLHVDKTLDVLTKITECRTRKDRRVVGTANKRLAMLKKWLLEGEDISDVEMTPLQDEPMEWQDIAQQIMEVRVEAPTSSIDYSSQIDDSGFSCSAVQFNNPNNRLLAVVDTNVFISNLHSLQNILQAYNAKDGDTSLPIFVVAWRVLVELDALKLRARLSGPARRAVAFLRQHLTTHPLVQGQSLGQASEHIYPCENADDEILNCCLQLSKAGQQVVLLSNDKNLCCKVTVNGVKACSVSDLMKTISSPNPIDTTPMQNKYIKNSINNNVLKARRRLTNTNTPYDVKSGTSPVKTHNLSPEKVSYTQNLTTRSTESKRFSGKTSSSSNFSPRNTTYAQNFEAQILGNANPPGNTQFISNRNFQDLTTSKNFGFDRTENVKVANQVPNHLPGGFQSVFGANLGVQDQNNEYMKNFEDCLLPVLNHLLELCFKRQFGESYSAPPLTLEQAIRNVLQHWSEIPVQPLSEDLHRAFEELRLVWVACSQGGQCSSFHVSRARQVAEELSLAANRVKLAKEQLLPAFEAIWTFFGNYCTSLMANECSIQHEVHTQLLKLLEALNRVLSLNDVVGVQGVYEVLRATLDGIGRREVQLTLDSIQSFCTNNRNLLEEARSKFSQLAGTLNS